MSLYCFDDTCQGIRCSLPGLLLVVRHCHPPVHVSFGETPEEEFSHFC